jgi:hypothetical protein
MDRHCATRRLRALAGNRQRPNATHASPHVAHTYVTAMSTPTSTFETSRSPPAMPIREPPCATTELGRTSTVAPNYMLAADMASGT